jgi:uncharacterized protein (TIGR03790 family)
MTSLLRRCLSALFFSAFAFHIQAGGSGLNVVIVVNQNSTNSVQLGNYYREQRQVPAQNFLRINWPGVNTVWATNDFITTLYNPLMALLGASQVSNQIDYVVLSMDIPYQLTAPGSSAINSTTSGLFYGFKPDPTSSLDCPMAPGSTNYYAGSEGIFRATPPINATSNSFLVLMITSSNLPMAKQIVDSGVMGDSYFPTQTVYLVKGPDVDRNVRYWSFDNAIFNTRLRGNYTMVRTNVSLFLGFPNIFGYQFGAYTIAMGGYAFLPGSLVDNLTSYGGLLFQDASGQLDLLALLAAGAAASYGTVDEPCNYLEKFPSPLDYFYQARGFSLAECYYLSVTNPYQGVFVGEPLSAPFATPASGVWSGLPTNALVTGTTNLSVQFAAHDRTRPLQQVDLFVDGVRQQTLTNMAPGRSNVLNVTVNGQSMNYLVALGTDIKSVAGGLAVTLNSASNTTKVVAVAHGDRIELQSVDRSKFGSQVPLSVSNSIGTGTALTTFLTTSRTNFLDTVAAGIRSFIVLGTPVTNTFIAATITRTNGAQVTIGATNSAGNLNLTQLAQQFVNALNGTAGLQGVDGLTAGDLITDSTGPTPPPQMEFNFLANSPGWNAAQIQAIVTSSPELTVSPSGTAALDQNLNDLQPRNHLYVTAGVTNLQLTFSFNTLTQADGFHELVAVAYEGSHVRTQARLVQSIQVSNSPLAATLTALVGGSNTALEATLQFSVVANTNNISKLELFSTGGSLGSVLNQASATFSVAGSYLGIGLHPFYAIVTANTGRQFRTATQWIRIIGADSPFRLSVSTPPPTLTWPATAGRSYDILSTTNLNLPFQAYTTATPSNSLARWPDTNPPAHQRFYRVRTTQ